MAMTPSQAAENNIPGAHGRSCGTCWYFNPEGPFNECRRLAPTRNPEADGWPTVKATAWCGEYTPVVRGLATVGPVPEKPPKRDFEPDAPIGRGGEKSPEPPKKDPGMGGLM